MAESEGLLASGEFWVAVAFLLFVLGAYRPLRRAITGALDERSARIRAELEEHYNRIGSPFRTAEHFAILDIIDPRETRGILCDWIEDAYEVLMADRHPSRRK